MEQLIGFKGGKAVYASQQAIATHGLTTLRREMCDLKLFPVKTSLSDNHYNTVMIEAKTHEEAIKIYFESKQYK